MRCDRCNRPCQDNPAGVPRLTEVTIKGRRAKFCDECGENVSAIHEVTDPKVVAEIKRPDDSPWVHKGGGYYENKETGETRRGRPEEGEGGGEDEGDEGEAKPDNADAEFTPKEEAPAAAESESDPGES